MSDKDDITQEYLRWIDTMKRITDREIEMNEALRRRSPFAEIWMKRIDERAKAMRAVDDAIERENQ